MCAPQCWGLLQNKPDLRAERRRYDEGLGERTGGNRNGGRIGRSVEWIARVGVLQAVAKIETCIFIISLALEEACMYRIVYISVNNDRECTYCNNRECTDRTLSGIYRLVVDTHNIIRVCKLPEVKYL